MAFVNIRGMEVAGQFSLIDHPPSRFIVYYFPAPVGKFIDAVDPAPEQDGRPVDFEGDAFSLCLTLHGHDLPALCGPCCLPLCEGPQASSELLSLEVDGGQSIRSKARRDLFFQEIS